MASGYIEARKHEQVRRMVSQHPSRELQCRELLKQVDLLSRKLVDTTEFCRLVNPLIE